MLIVSTLRGMDDAGVPNETKSSLRARIKEAGGWYAYFNTKLIKFAGPAAVGPYEKTPAPSPEARAQSACPLCAKPIAEHTFDRSGPKTLMHCPR